MIRRPMLTLLFPIVAAACGEAPEPAPGATPTASAPAPPAAVPPPPVAAPPPAARPVAAPGGAPAIEGLRTVGSETQYDIILPTDILFDFDKAALRPEAQPMLQAVDTHLKAHGADQLHIKGYTDAKGSDQYNFRLSMRRAAAVCDWLKAAGQRTTNCIGRGEQDPIAANARPDGSDDPEGRQQNRRVAISVVKYPDAKAMLDRARDQTREGMETLR